jgi:hypothetical protein
VNSAESARKVRDHIRVKGQDLGEDRPFGIMPEESNLKCPSGRACWRRDIGLDEGGGDFPAPGRGHW